MTRITALKVEWLKEPRFRAAYEALEDEFMHAEQLLKSREGQIAKMDGRVSRGLPRAGARWPGHDGPPKRQPD